MLNPIDAASSGEVIVRSATRLEEALMKQLKEQKHLPL